MTSSSRPPDTFNTSFAGDANAPDLAYRLSYLGLGPADQTRLRELGPVVEEFSAELVEAFYRHLFSFESSARFLRDPQVVERLKELQRQHFVSLTEADWDEKYEERRRRVGQTHANVGIDPELFLGAYNQYVQQAIPRYLAAAGGGDSPQIEAVLSLLKVVFLDLGLTLDAYFTQATQTIRQALDMYWKANVELRQFAHLASHDLKTPLATVANFCEEALDEFGEQMPTGAKDLIESARQRTFRMSRMIDELLSVTTSFDLQSQLAETSTQAALADALERLKPVIAEKQLTVSMPESLPIVWGDLVRLREAFYNVLSNAVKFSPAKTGRIVMDVRPIERGYEFSFADNGPGIPAEDLETIFAPFRRSSRHRDTAGSGLGLYFAKTLVEYQGGGIRAESTPGQGSCFYIALRQPAE
ncbi:MAG: protoglobin domain-containing protein [Pirellulales bacterium]